MDPPRWEEIETAFSELVALDAIAQRERLAALGATDPALRAAVEQLLAADAAAETRLAPLAGALVSPAIGQLDGLAAALGGHYRVERELGHGGMATVYLAHDLKHDRPVALKVLKPELAAALGRARFLREVALTARLDHPHIVPLLDSGEAGRLVYYVMPYVDGESLRDRLDREKQLSVEDALQITHEVADALDYAHGHGIIHRDIKPANILLGGGHARVADFGIARAVSAAGGEQLTETGIAVGTPAYMSLEQATADRDVDARSDVYSLACVVYEMLAGQPPYTGATPEAILARRAVEAVPSVRVVRAAVPAGVEQALTRALAKVPADRFATVRQFSVALQRGAHERRSPPPRRTLRRVLLGAATAILVGAAVLAVRSYVRRAAELGAVVVMPFENRTGDASLDPLGTITADWVAQGLNEPGFLTVRDISEALSTAAGLGPGASPAAVGHETGAGVVVAGSYFLVSDSLRFEARIVSAGEGSIMNTVSVAAARARPQEGAEQLRQRLLAALAPLHDKDIGTFQPASSQPPTYDAYREYVEGLERYMRSDFPAAGQYFDSAAALDSTFLVARLWAAQSAVLVGWHAGSQRAGSILTDLKPLRDRLRPVDRARFDYVAALREVLAPGGGTLLDSAEQAEPLQAAYRAAKRMMEAAPGFVDVRREAALSALRVFRPRESLRLLETLDPERGLMREWWRYWWAVAWAHHRLGEHGKELAAVRRGWNVAPPGSLLFPELRALAALGRVAELDSLAHAEFRHSPEFAVDLAYDLVGEVLAHGHPALAHSLARDAAELLATHPPPYSTGDLGTDDWLRERTRLALLLGDLPTATACIAKLRHPDEQGFLAAHVLAAQGRRNAALAALEMALRRVTRSGAALDRQAALDAAGVRVRLNDLDGALNVLEQTSPTDPVFLGSGGQDGHADLELAPLWHDPRFQALIKPRG
jgi:tetratricopeptide (TPR) repeat protein/TolB-like protein